MGDLSKDAVMRKIKENASAGSEPQSFSDMVLGAAKSAVTSVAGAFGGNAQKGMMGGSKKGGAGAETGRKFKYEPK